MQNHFPAGIRYRYLPRSYSSQSASGRYVFLAAIQNSICTVMTENFRPPIRPYAGQGFWAISEALLRSNESHEAIWRLMTVNAILNDQRTVDGYKANLREVAKTLRSSWNPFPGDNQKGETLERLSRLLIDSAMIFLDLQKDSKRIHVGTEVVSQYFESDSEEDLHTVPGGFELPDSTAAVLCPFRAFFWTTSSGATLQNKLLRKGTAMFRDLPPLLAAFNEAQEARSPSMSNRRRPTNWNCHASLRAYPRGGE